MNQEWFQVVQQLQYTIQSQQQKLEELERELHAIQAELDNIKRTPPTTVGKVEYKFDQLKVENLNGTLNIGLNPYGGGAIEDFDVATETLKVNPETEVNPDFYQDIIQQMNRYLDQEAYHRILQFEADERVPLDDTYRNMMIDDIRKQMEHRLPYYLSQVQPYPEITSNPEYMKDIIIHNMKQDIDKAFMAFIQHIPPHMRKE
ncbi:spore germination protein GerPC [Ectobacillus antri]|jgi:spore germination protein PC|uniref:Spore germination protein GerPC n=1 Tax=Ectobacillus antri TaxID=2486280 RepID=A0ABT6H3G6_9BACI|nr:spore germination protein GerPC [Ectobacillus antri]MDG4656707.1 spore germination protein GerPC [Ectobacillus antri]MDG5753930.1 spore germination protein GerPC [Ectobacillus antri]